MDSPQVEAYAPIDVFGDAVVEYLARLSPREFAQVVAQARPPILSESADHGAVA